MKIPDEISLSETLQRNCWETPNNPMKWIYGEQIVGSYYVVLERFFFGIRDEFRIQKQSEISTENDINYCSALGNNVSTH